MEIYGNIPCLQHANERKERKVGNDEEGEREWETKNGKKLKRERKQVRRRGWGGREGLVG